MKFRRTLAMAAATVVTGLGLASPALASATHTPAVHHATAVSAPSDVPNDVIKNYALQHYAGGSGGYLYDNGQYNSFTAHLAGQVNSSTPWPFNNGSGFNSTYNGDNVWYFTETSSPSACINVGGDYAVIATSCGGNHDGSLWVSTNAPNGVSGVHGLVNVYDSDAAGAGRYMEDPGSGLKIVVPGYAYGSNYESWVF